MSKFIRDSHRGPVFPIFDLPKPIPKPTPKETCFYPKCKEVLPAFHLYCSRHYDSCQTPGCSKHIDNTKSEYCDSCIRMYNISVLNVTEDKKEEEPNPNDDGDDPIGRGSGTRKRKKWQGKRRRKRKNVESK